MIEPTFTENSRRIFMLRRDGSVRAEALVDGEDYERVVAAGPWRIVSKCYVAAHAGARGDRQCIYLHRFVMGVTDPAVHVDHRNGDTLDCRKENLRLVTNAQNLQNQHTMRGGSSIYRGVSWHKAAQKWQAYATLHQKRVHLGLFDSEEEAARVAADYRAAHMPYSQEATTR